MKAARLWPAAVVALLAVHAGVHIVLLGTANNPARAYVEPDYYRRALAWDTTQAARGRSAALGWRFDAGLAPAPAGGAILAGRLFDSGGRVIPDAIVEVEAIHNLDPGHPVRERLAATGDGGYAGTLALDRPGRWELRIAGRRGGDRFTIVLHRDLGGGR